MIETLNFITCTFGVSGAILVGEQRRLGFLLFIVSSAAMLILGLIRSDYGVILLQLVFIIIDAYYVYRWRDMPWLIKIKNC